MDAMNGKPKPIESTGHHPTDRERALAALDHARTVLEQQAAKARIALMELGNPNTEGYK